MIDFPCISKNLSSLFVFNCDLWLLLHLSSHSLDCFSKHRFYQVSHLLKVIPLILRLLRIKSRLYLPMVNKTHHFLGLSYFSRLAFLQWFSNVRFGIIKFLLFPWIPLCWSPLYIPACSPFNLLSHFCWQKFIHFRDNSTCISILHSFLSPPSTSGCFFLCASLSSCICLHYNKDSFALDLPLCLTGSQPIYMFLGGRCHFLFIVIHPSMGYHFSPAIWHLHFH